jgi:hypothetical protein
MLISDAQCEMRTVYVGGFVGQLTSALIWFASATIATVVDPKTGFWALAIGGAAIFPLTQALLRMSGRRAVVNPQNALAGLAMQIAFTVPFVLPLAGAAALYKLGWFYPACMVIVGAHYLPFVFLYGMKTFALLAAALIGAGFAIVFLAPTQVVMGGWIGGAILLSFAFVLVATFKRGSSAASALSAKSSCP